MNRKSNTAFPLPVRKMRNQEIRLLLINCNPCKTLYLNNLESGGVVGDKVEIVAEYCSLGKPKNQVLEGIVGQALALPTVVSAGWEVL